MSLHSTVVLLKEIAGLGRKAGESPLHSTVVLLKDS